MQTRARWRLNGVLFPFLLVDVSFFAQSDLLSGLQDALPFLVSASFIHWFQVLFIAFATSLPLSELLPLKQSTLAGITMMASVPA